MTTPRAIACALALSIAATTTVWAADKKKSVRKPAGRTETLACRLGTEDRHARIAVVVIKGKTDSFAYYSKWKPRTCSIYLQRNRDPYSKWADTGDVTTVNLEKGAFLIEHKPGEYHFVFRDVDRERYCGMDGVINGTLTIKRGKDQCILGGDIMVEGTPLGHVPAAYANVETPPPAAGASDIPAAIAAPVAKAAPAAAEQQGVAPATEATAVSKAGVGAPAAEAATAPATVAAPPAASAAAVAAEPAERQSATVEATQQKSATSEPAQPQTSAAAEQPGTVPAEKSADASSDNSLRSFFRALAPRPAEEQSPFP